MKYCHKDASTYVDHNEDTISTSTTSTETIEVHAHF
jgi:hypothetical protein